MTEFAQQSPVDAAWATASEALRPSAMDREIAEDAFRIAYASGEQQGSLPQDEGSLLDEVAARSGLYFNGPKMNHYASPLVALGIVAAVEQRRQRQGGDQ